MAWSASWKKRSRPQAWRYRPQLVVLEGRVLPSFLPPVTYPVGLYPFSVATADFTGDGIPDLVEANNLPSGTVKVLPGNGDGTFQTPIVSDAGYEPRDLAVGDFNGDGIPDLVVANQSEPTSMVSVLLGNGDGTFQTPQSYPVGNLPYAIAVGDFTGNGIPDLVTANFNDNTVSVLLGNGDGTFQAAQDFPAGNVPVAVAVGDFRGIGYADIAVANETINGTVTVLLGNGDGSFQAAQSYATDNAAIGVTVADLNGDGIPDLAVTNNASDTVSVLLGNGDGSFQKAKHYAVGQAPHAILTTDLNGDGIPDLVMTGAPATVNVLLGKGDGTFQAVQQFSAGNGSAAGLAAADLNGDGYPDVVLAGGTASSSLRVLINAADWGDGASPPAPAPPPALLTAPPRSGSLPTPDNLASNPSRPADRAVNHTPEAAVPAPPTTVPGLRHRAEREAVAAPRDGSAAAELDSDRLFDATWDSLFLA